MKIVDLDFLDVIVIGPHRRRRTGLELVRILRARRDQLDDQIKAQMEKTFTKGTLVLFLVPPMKKPQEGTVLRVTGGGVRLQNVENHVVRWISAQYILEIREGRQDE